MQACKPLDSPALDGEWHSRKAAGLRSAWPGVGCAPHAQAARLAAACNRRVGKRVTFEGGRWNGSAAATPTTPGATDDRARAIGPIWRFLQPEQQLLPAEAAASGQCRCHCRQRRGCVHASLGVPTSSHARLAYKGCCPTCGCCPSTACLLTLGIGSLLNFVNLAVGVLQAQRPPSFCRPSLA